MWDKFNSKFERFINVLEECDDQSLAHAYIDHLSVNMFMDFLEETGKKRGKQIIRQVVAKTGYGFLLNEKNDQKAKKQGKSLQRHEV